MTGINYAPRLTKEKYLQHIYVDNEYRKQSGMWHIMNIYKRARKHEDIEYYKHAWKKAVSKRPDIWIKYKILSFSKSLGYKTKMIGLIRANGYQGEKKWGGLQKQSQPVLFYH